MTRSGRGASDPASRVRLKGPEDIVAAVPFLFGYEPSASLVVIGMRGSRGRLSTSMRVDLPPSEHVGEVVASTMDFLRRDRPDRVVMLIYPAPHLTPAGPLGDAFAAALSEEGIGVSDCLVVRDGRWWSLRCTNPDCCPLEGTPVARVDRPTAELTAAVLGVSAPVESRDALEARVRPLRGASEATMRSAILRNLDEWGRELDDLECEEAADPLAKRVLAGIALVERGVRAMTPGPAATSLLDDEAAWLLVSLSDLRLRDAAIELALAGDDEDARRESRSQAEAFWLDLTRRAVDEWAAAPATISGLIAWQSGSGTRARIAVERALECDPGYSLALLLERTLDAGMSPSFWRTEMIGECG